MAITTATGAKLRTGPTDFGLGYDAANVTRGNFLERIVPAIRDLTNSQTHWLDAITKNSGVREAATMEGAYMVIGLNTEGSQGHGWIGEMANLPDPDPQTYDRATFLPHHHYIRVLFSGPSRAASQSRRTSFVEVAAGEITGSARDAAVDTSRMLWGDGSGTYALVQSGTTGTTISVYNPYGFANGGPGTQILRPRMRVLFLNASTKAIEAVGTIASVNYTNNTITLGASVTVTTNALIVRCSEPNTSDVASSGYLRTTFGLSAACSDTNPEGRFFGQIDRNDARAEYWRSYVNSNNGISRQYNPMMLQQLQDGMYQHNQGNVVQFWTSFGIRRQHMASELASQRHNREGNLDSGMHVSMDWNQRPIIPDRDCPRGHIFGVDFSCLSIATMGGDYHFINDGNVLSRVPNKDAYEATLARYSNLVCDAPSRLGVIKDLMDTAA